MMTNDIKTRWMLIGMLTLSLVLSASGVFAQPDYEKLTFPPLNFTPPTVERHTLSNGMTIFFAPDHELPIISMYALVKTGAIYEPADNIGLTSIVAEVMRTGGTETYSADDINDMLEFIAASVEVDISEDSGSVELWTLKRNLDTALKVFADVLRHPVFAQDKIDLAKNQMLEDIRRRNDSPANIRGREFMRVLYGSHHPLARIPQIETITAITRDDLVAFHQTYFHPNNIMLAVTGDFEPADMLNTLTNMFQSWPSADIKLPEVEPVNYEFSPGVYLVDKDVEQTNLGIGHLGIMANNPDYPAVRVLDLILGSGGFSSRLFQKVRTERGLAYSVGSYLGAGTRDYAPFLIYCGTRNDAVQETIQVILDAIKEMLATEVTDRELESAKNQYLNSYIFKFATVDDIIRRKMFYEYVGYPPDFLETFRDNVMQVTKADVLRAAQTYLHPEKMKILAVGSRSQIESALATFGAVQSVELEPVE